MKQAALVLGLIVLVLGAVIASVELAGHFLGNSEAKADTVQCSTTKVVHEVTIKNDRMTPAVTTAHLCDKLTIINLDYRLREIAFGPHDHHVAYDGVLERFINQGQSVTVTLNQAGSFSFHDHIEDNLIGYFNVSGS